LILSRFFGVDVSVQYLAVLLITLVLLNSAFVRRALPLPWRSKGWWHP
jgi:hypothetical protein